MKRWLKIGLWIIASLLIAFLIFGLLFYQRFVISPPDYTFIAPRDLVEAQQQDLAYLSLYPDYDKSFDAQMKLDSFYAQIHQLERKLPVSEAVFEMEVAKALAYADNSHTNSSACARAKRLNNIPLRFYWFEEGLFTILAQEDHKAFLGKRIVSLNGLAPEVLLHKIAPWHGGTAENRKVTSPLFFISPEILHAIGLGSNPHSIQVSIKEEDGNILTQEVFASSDEKDVPGYWVPYWLHPYEQIMGSKWRACKPENLPSIPIQHIRQNVHHAFIEHTLYVQINDNYNTEERHLRDYLKAVTAQMKEKQPRQVILDLRFNPGGNNYHLPWPFIRSLHDYLDEDQRCWIITGHGTFSAGLITAAYAKYTLGAKASIVGEKLGDRMQFWADGGTKMTLPNSKIPLRIWTAFHDWENGCRDLSTCFWFAYFDSVPAGDLTPDVEIPLSYSDFMKGRDSVLDYIMKRNSLGLYNQ